MIDADRIAANCRALREELADATRRAGRPPESVRLVAVTKYVGPEVVPLLCQAGCLDLGESRPQELLAKAAAATTLPVRWHLIGHLQRNKARRILPLLDWIHSVDSLRLLDALDRLAEETGAAPRALLEVNISGDAEKHGFAPAEMPAVVEQLGERKLPVVGLMGMSARGSAPDEARRSFASLRQLRDSLQPQCPAGVRLDELSMGMSGDWRQAVAEGATLVRIGSALYEGAT